MRCMEGSKASSGCEDGRIAGPHEAGTLSWSNERRAALEP